MALYERSGAKFYLQLSLGETGHTYLMKGELKSAIPYLQQALSIASEMGNTADAAIWAGNLSAVYSELGDWPNAESLNQEAIRLKNSAHLWYPLLQLPEFRTHRVGPRRFGPGRTPV